MHLAKDGVSKSAGAAARRARSDGGGMRCFWPLLTHTANTHQHKQTHKNNPNSYRHTSYHKQTKNQWARDDPAFVVVCCALVAAAAAAYCVTYSDSVWHALLTVLSAVLVDFLLLGLAVSSAAWYAANRFLRRRNLPSHAVEQHVEWLYAFDVHCNSYFPLFLLLYGEFFVVCFRWRVDEGAVCFFATLLLSQTHNHTTTHNTKKP